MIKNADFATAASLARELLEQVRGWVAWNQWGLSQRQPAGPAPGPSQGGQDYPPGYRASGGALRAPRSTPGGTSITGWRKSTPARRRPGHGLRGPGPGLCLRHPHPPRPHRLPQPGGFTDAGVGIKPIREGGVLRPLPRRGPASPRANRPRSGATGLIAMAKSFFRYGRPYNPPRPPLKKGGKFKELLLKSPFEKGGFRQQCPVRKLHAEVPPPSPQTSPPEAWGKGVGDFARFNNHNVLNGPLFPSPPMGERARVRGK